MYWCDITQNGDGRGHTFVGEGGRGVHILCKTWKRAELVLVPGADPSGRTFVAAKEYVDDDDVECIFSWRRRRTWASRCSAEARQRNKVFRGSSHRWRCGSARCFEVRGSEAHLWFWNSLVAWLLRALLHGWKKVVQEGGSIAWNVSHHCLRVSFQGQVWSSINFRCVVLGRFFSEEKRCRVCTCCALRCRWSDEIRAAGQEDEVGWSHAVVVAGYTLKKKNVDKVFFDNIHLSDEGNGRHVFLSNAFGFWDSGTSANSACRFSKFLTTLQCEVRLTGAEFPDKTSPIEQHHRPHLARGGPAWYDMSGIGAASVDTF